MATVTMLPTTEPESLVRNDVMAALKRNLKARSVTRYSVTGGRGTAYGWICITKLGESWMSDADRQELAALLGLDSVHQQGYKIPSSNDYYREALDRTAGRPVRKIATPYWD